MNKKVILIGNGVHAKVIADIIKCSKDEIVGFIVEKKFGTQNALGLKWLGDFSAIDQYKEECEFIIGIGSNEIRKKIAKEYDLNWYTAIHPNCVIDMTSEIEEGTCLMANSVINSCAKVGKHCIINTGAIVEHDCTVGSYSHLSPNSVICGSVHLGENVHLGAGGTVINEISIVGNTKLGAGVCVVSNIEEEGTYVGVPAKRVKKC